MPSAQKIHWLNAALIVGSYALAWRFPYQLFFFVYAFVGPAHYLTQISWLHDRRYFVGDAKILLPMGIATLIAVIFGNKILACATVFSASLAAFYLWTPKCAKHRVSLSVLIAILVVWLLPPVAAFAAIIVPTVLHVFVFTLAFMLAGALREQSKSAFAPMLLFFTGGISFFFIPHAMISANYHADDFPIAMFNSVAVYLSELIGNPVAIEKASPLFAFLSFAYTYHYLNWFSKAEVIHWHRIPRRRLLAIATFYLLSIGCYLVDYRVGFYVLLFLSVLHVVLEFPLNLRTFERIVRGGQQPS